MNFRIKSSNQKTNLNGDYLQHLIKYPKYNNPDLWTFFHNDFFADGCIEAIRFENNLSTLVLELSCPNIVQKTGPDTLNYLNAGFTCKFHQISHFTLKSENPEFGICTDISSAIFISSEINSHPDLRFIVEEDDEIDCNYSLLIQGLVDDPFWLEIIFEEMEVTPNEPLAFALMQSHPDFEIPFFVPKAD